MKRLNLVFLILCIAWLPQANAAFPDRPLKLIVPFAAGDVLDGAARVLAERMSDVLKQPVVVENRPGAGGYIAGAAVSKAPADGYTLMFGTVAMMAITPRLRKAPYDPEDFEPIAKFAFVLPVFSVNETVPVKSWQEFVAYAKNRPEQLTYGTPGDGTWQHIATEYLLSRVGAKMTPVPYRGMAPAVADFLAGRVTAVIDPTAFVHLQAGKGRGLLAMGNSRFGGLPDTPSAKELGIDFGLESWFGIFAPRGLPPDVAKRLEGAVALAVASQELQSKLPVGVKADYLNAAQFRRLISSDMEQYARLLETMKIKLE